MLEKKMLGVPHADLISIWIKLPTFLQNWCAQFQKIKYRNCPNSNQHITYHIENCKADLCNQERIPFWELWHVK
jgi:hypothetical protein